MEQTEKELQYRIPKKVTHEATLYKVSTCPTCKHVVGKYEKWGDTYVQAQWKYCVFCGQALDWIEE